MPSNTRTRLVVVALVVLAVAVGVTVFGQSLPESDARAVTIADRAADEMENTTAYTIDVGGKASVQANDQTRRAHFDGRAAFNRTTRWYYLHITLGDDEETRYLNGYTAYRPCPYARFVNVPNASHPVQLPKNRSWTSYTLLGGQHHLNDISHLYYRGTTTLDGEEVYKILVVPNQKELRAFSRGVPAEEGSDQQLKNVSGTMYVSTETYRPLRVVVEREGGGLFRPSLQSEIVYDVSYGSTAVPRPEMTVESESQCPRP